MSEPKSSTLSTIIRTGWKLLANVDQSDSDEVAKILREVLEDLERLESAGE